VQSVQSWLAMNVFQNTYHGFIFQPSLHLCEDQLQQQVVLWKRPEAVEYIYKLQNIKFQSIYKGDLEVMV
jgi:hypothetical protein